MLFVILPCILAVSQAKIMQCNVQKDSQITKHFFDSNDKFYYKKCTSKPKLVVNFKPEKTKSKYLDSAKKNKTKIVSKSCSGSGGTVKANGKVLHLDIRTICKKYGFSSKRNIRLSFINNVKLSRIDANFRRKIASFVNKIAKKHGMEPEFIHAIISAESSYKVNATSSVGAMGLMQLMPFTARRFGVHNAYNPQQNIEAGTRYLKLLYDEFGSLELAAAGFNAGEGSIRKYNNSVPPYIETKNYVTKVMRYYYHYKKMDL